MKEIDANREAWSLLSKEHYEHFKQGFEDGTFNFNMHIDRELGDVRGKRLLHLQCNTGADTLYLARKGAIVTGVDLVPENIEYANRLAQDLGIEDARFITSDVLKLTDVLDEQFDIVFTSEGVLGWLPDLPQWGRVIRACLKDNGFFYVYDMHPTYLMMEEEAFARGEFVLKYPYFSVEADVDETIGGYAAPPRPGRNYFWMHTMGDIVNALADVGLRIGFLHEFDHAICDLGNMTRREDGVYVSDHYLGRFPLSFSIRATVG